MQELYILKQSLIPYYAIALTVLIYPSKFIQIDRYISCFLTALSCNKFSCHNNFLQHVKMSLYIEQITIKLQQVRQKNFYVFTSKKTKRV